MIASLRTITHNARVARDRWLHPLRRRAAKRRLAEYEGTFILVVCQGNVCRSPLAEAVLQVSFPTEWKFARRGWSLRGDVRLPTRFRPRAGSGSISPGIRPGW